ncbi:type II toxin-antitoxin system mRNA interferase toxin, RelE/StbE family [Bartonella melophagi]|uniref:YafQ family addiction module toxin component n=1 Tax=Bartonella melophagi K-2C TaxID=1094557 RepID=J0QXW6_9HYPH|nr:type II toxin-antitoxin system mRNA interferase toxin, RelE/StbE family [Bartonella melophagi]EJF88029.1 YafQ family addiction module toxin component [Bartonella melophagi K-2C]
MFQIVRSNQFKRDIKMAIKRGKDLEKIKRVMLLLQKGKPLPLHYKDHPLKANWHGFRDVHIEPDWLLIYKISDNQLRFERTGTHSDLFK